MPRTHLPPRRRMNTYKFEYGGHTHYLSVEYYSNDKIGEVFLATGKVGSAIDNLVKDGAVLISIALQYGATPTELAKSVSETTEYNTNVAGSLIGAMVRRLVEIENEH
jgi:hypothetical protein